MAYNSTMSRLQTQGVHHITFVGSNREATIEFYQGVLGMPLITEQPNLDAPEELSRRKASISTEEALA